MEVQFPLFLTSTLNGIGWLNSCLGRFIPGKKFVPIGKEAGWAPESVWTIWGREKNALSLPGFKHQSVQSKDYSITDICRNSYFF
jgi:hypothetical protein